MRIEKQHRQNRISTLLFSLLAFSIVVCTFSLGGTKSWAGEENTLSLSWSADKTNNTIERTKPRLFQLRINHNDNQASSNTTVTKVVSIKVEGGLLIDSDHPQGTERLTKTISIHPGQTAIQELKVVSYAENNSTVDIIANEGTKLSNRLTAIVKAKNKLYFQVDNYNQTNERWIMPGVNEKLSNAYTGKIYVRTNSGTMTSVTHKFSCPTTDGPHTLRTSNAKATITKATFTDDKKGNCQFTLTLSPLNNTNGTTTVNDESYYHLASFTVTGYNRKTWLFKSIYYKPGDVSATWIGGEKGELLHPSKNVSIKHYLMQNGVGGNIWNLYSSEGFDSSYYTLWDHTNGRQGESEAYMLPLFTRGFKPNGFLPGDLEYKSFNMVLSKEVPYTVISVPNGKIKKLVLNYQPSSSSYMTCSNEAADYYRAKNTTNWVKKLLDDKKTFPCDLSKPETLENVRTVVFSTQTDPKSTDFNGYYMVEYDDVPAGTYSWQMVQAYSWKYNSFWNNKDLGEDPNGTSVGTLYNEGTCSECRSKVPYWMKPTIIVGSKHKVTVSGKANLVQGETFKATVNGLWSGRPGQETTLDYTVKLPAGIDYLSNDKGLTPEITKTNGQTTLVFKDMKAVSRQPLLLGVELKATGVESNKTGMYPITASSRSSVINGEERLNMRTANSSAYSPIVASAGSTSLVTAENSTFIAGKGLVPFKFKLKNEDSVTQDKVDTIFKLPETDTEYSLAKVDAPEDWTVQYSDAPGSIDPADSQTWTNNMTGAKMVKVSGTKLAQQEEAEITIWLNLNKPKIGEKLTTNAGARASNTELLMLRALPIEIVSDGSTLQVAKNVTEASKTAIIKPGDKVTYQIQIHNESKNPAYQVEVKDEARDGIEKVFIRPHTSATINCASGGEKTCTASISEIEAGQTVTLDVDAYVAKDWDGSPLLNLASAHNPSNPPKTTCNPNKGYYSLDNDQCEINNFTPRQSDFKVTKKKLGNNNTVHVGDEIEFLLEVENLDKEAALDGVKIEEKPSKHLELSSFNTPSQGSIDGESLTWVPGLIAPGGKASVKAKFKVKDAGGLEVGEVVENLAQGYTPDKPVNCLDKWDEKQCSKVSIPTSPNTPQLALPFAGVNTYVLFAIAMVGSIVIAGVVFYRGKDSKKE